MIKFVLSLTILALFASPLFAQSLPERLAAVERNNAALSEAVARVEADVATIKMNQSAHGAVLDSLVAKVDKLMKATPAAASHWGNAPNGGDPSPPLSNWTSSPAASYSSAPMMRSRGLFPRLRGGSCGAGG